MRDIISLKLNMTGLCVSLAIIYIILKEQYEGNFQILDYMEFSIPLLLLIINISFNRLIVNSRGISKALIFPKLKYNNKTWGDIKHFINVTEIDMEGDETEAVWFIDSNDKVCLRMPKDNILSMHKLEKIMKLIKQKEVEYPHKLIFKSPFWYIFGFSKVDYSKKEKP